MEKNRKIKLDPFHAESKNLKDGKFLMKFFAKATKGKRKQCYEVEIIMSDWWIKYLVSDFKKVLKDKENDIKEIQKHFTTIEEID